MSVLISPGSDLLYMKVGIHARESLADILKRKIKEIDQTGIAFWGYGGNTCHPTNMVQPFAEAAAKRDEAIHLCMEEINSKHDADPIPADEYSEDGLLWKPVPKGIGALGSRYALIINGLRRDEFCLPLVETQVACGNSLGKPGDEYIRGRVDKACLKVTGGDSGKSNGDNRIARISLVAELAHPFAVFLRNSDAY